MTRNTLLRKQLLWALALFVALLLLQWVAPYIAPAYTSVFASLQIMRCTILGRIPFSIGDLLYAAGLLWLLIKVIRFFRKKKQERLGLPALLSVTCIGLSLYLIVTLLWGILYEQPKLSKRLALQDLHELSNEELISFDSTLIQRLNYYEPLFRTTTLNNCGKELSATYRSLGFRMPVSVKPGILGNGLAYWGVSGYYNPFTGEAQVNAQEPDFMLPFVAAHEMAHQTGIAAEDDANLMAYIACVENGSNNACFSAYFNIWLYTHRKVHRIDSTIAGRLKLQLHPGTLHRIDILRARDERFHTWLDDVSTVVFDLYLKMGNQQDGIQSYRNVAWSALAWEKSKRKKY